MSVVIGFTACQSMNVELFSTNASDCKLYYHEQELIVVITSIPFGKESQSFSQTCIWLETKILFKRCGISISHWYIAGLHRYKFLVGFKVIIIWQYTSTNQFFLEDGNEVKEVFWRVVTNIIYFIWRNWQTIFAILLFWCMLHDTNYTFYDVVNECEVTFTVAIVENLDGFAFHQFVGESEVRHIWATCGTIHCEEAKA